MDHAMGIGQEPHSTTPAGTGWLLGYWPLLRKRKAVVLRPRNPDLAARFAGASAGGFAVPTYVDIPAMVGRYGSSTIESKGLLHEVSLRLKCRASVVQTCIKHRRAGLTSFWVQWSSGFCRLRSIPGNMHTIPLAYGNLGPPNCTNRDGASRLAVDPNRRGKSSPEVFRSGIKNIALFWVAREIDQVDDAFRHSYLRL
jgi:hypothetical protein